ncbi:MAG2960 family serine endopeptidase lipoprotein [Mesomycoplasma ovipneumoniae]|uniref:MAG2960 family serine endopeptidase lipoprotein n=1 Tax=Mesomycoplasma ovipneumoniae TaxID=29562 RepID=UPI002964CBC3|nr:lipoprotein [Mesomycoplasma ovipneumoniae]MDW2834932.1 lipoprotein [Mesomycoplasma ovipneumoniae]MDW2891054.1 lipoprotein [Mesomycoplasma ovipneumoniae]
MKKLSKLIFSNLFFGSLSIILFSACNVNSDKLGSKEQISPKVHAKIENQQQTSLDDVDWKNINFEYDSKKYNLEKLNLNKNFEQNLLTVSVLLVDNEKQLSIPKEFVFTSFLKVKDKIQEQNLDEVQKPVKEEELKKVEKSPNPQPNFSKIKKEKILKPPSPSKPEITRIIRPQEKPKSQIINNPSPTINNVPINNPPINNSPINRINSNQFQSVNYNTKAYNPLFETTPKLKYTNRIYSESQNPEYFKDDHYFDQNFLLNHSVMQIIQNTPKYQTGVHNLYTFLYNGDNNQPINFLDPNDPNRNKRFWELAKNVGHYGDFGKNNDEKLMFYNRGISYNGMAEQVYLPKFSETQSSGASSNSENLTEIVKKNPFGFLPSNLSQLFYYMKIDEIGKIFKIANLKKVSANFDDKKGEISILFESGDGKKQIWKSSSTNSNLKKDVDYEKFIYDRSFSLGVYGYKYFQNPYIWNDYGTHAFKENGTAWVLDRITNNDTNSDSYELLVGTNIHVWNMAQIFDKSMYFFDVNNQSEKSKIWNAGFVDQSYKFISEKDTKNADKSRPFFTAARSEHLISDNKYENTYPKIKEYPVFDAYDSYLSAPYYTPRYKVDGIMGHDVDVGYKYLDNYNEATRVGTTKNGGSDFVILRLKIKKTDLEHILPELKKAIDSGIEKEWHIGLGRNEKFSPIKTQFYGGYPVATKDNENGDWDKGVNFKSNKSTGGIINTRSRVINDSLFHGLWTPYNDAENKDWNSKHEKWKNYQKPFLDNLKHGMLKMVLNQHSNLYTKVNSKNKLDALGPGSSGSMAIDSSFNLIGINYSYSTDSESNTFSNAISLMEGQSTYLDGFNGNIREDFKKKLQKDGLYTVKINPKS